MHHALLYIDAPHTCSACVAKLQAELGIAPIDTRVYEEDKFPIESARELIRVVGTTPLGGEKTLTVIAAEHIGHHAQNALLKITEEPPAHAYVVLLIPSEDMLLPTLRSRFVRVDEDSTKGEQTLAKDFLKSSTTERQKITEKIVKDKDTFAAKKLIRDLEVVYASFKDKEKYIDEIQDLMACRQYVEQNGASIKFMLEHLALTLPQIK